MMDLGFGKGIRQGVPVSSGPPRAQLAMLAYGDRSAGGSTSIIFKFEHHTQAAQRMARTVAIVRIASFISLHKSYLVLH